MMVRTFAAWAVAMAGGLAACTNSTSSPSHDDGGGSGADGGASDCGAGTITITADGVSTSNTCFQASVFKDAASATALGQAGNTLLISVNASASQYGTDSSGIGISFASGCSFATGQVIQLSDPCISISGGVIGNSSGPITSNPCGDVNTCVPDYVGGNTALVCDGCLAWDSNTTLPTQSASQTTGTLTLNHWSVTPGDTVSLTIAGTLTSITVATPPTPPYSVDYSAAAISGTASAVILLF